MSGKQCSSDTVYSGSGLLVTSAEDIVRQWIKDLTPLTRLLCGKQSPGTRGKTRPSRGRGH